MAKPVAGRGGDGSSGSGSSASSSTRNGTNGRVSRGAEFVPLSPDESAARLRTLGFAASASEQQSCGMGGACSAGLQSSDGSGSEQAEEERILPYNGLRRRLISPLDIHFSQSHIRPEFQDGRTVEEGAAAVEQELLSIPADWDLEAIGLPTAEDANESKNWWLLKPPFPEIEVIQWRCKLRKEDGTIVTDAQGNELYGDRAWYTLDNRRLYCLQQVAARLHPTEVRCAVITIRQEDGNCREFRKFRTPDLGRTVRIGHRDSSELPRWSWRREAGLPEAPLPQGTPILARPPKRRGSGRGPHSGDRRGSGKYVEEDEDDENGRWDPLSNVLFFVLIYALMRIAFHVFKYATGTQPSRGGLGAAVAAVLGRILGGDSSLPSAASIPASVGPG